MSILEAYESELKTFNELIVKSTDEYPKQAGGGKEAKEKAITEIEALFAQVSINVSTCAMIMFLAETIHY